MSELTAIEHTLAEYIRPKRDASRRRHVRVPATRLDGRQAPPTDRDPTIHDAVASLEAGETPDLLRPRTDTGVGTRATVAAAIEYVRGNPPPCGGRTGKYVH